MGGTKPCAFSEIGKTAKGRCRTVGASLGQPRLKQVAARLGLEHALAHCCTLTPPIAPQLATELLYGGRQGTFQYNKTLTVTSVTADGVVSSLGWESLHRAFSSSPGCSQQQQADLHV